jgi:Ca2+ transporting ATPase
MVTGDNLTTATAIAIDCGILPKGFVSSKTGFEAIEGKRFREFVEGIRTFKDKDDCVKHRVGNLEKF